MNIPQGKKIAESVYNIHEYILKMIADGQIEPPFRKLERRLAYHIPCHLRAMGIGYPGAKLMSLIPGLKTEILDDFCCGLSGSYGFKKSNEYTAVQIGKRAVAHIQKTGAEAIVADCGSCRMQLEGLSGIHALDPAEIISESLGITLEK
jgi:glycerol-3-phosphate dehydrogenase subunit C